MKRVYVSKNKLIRSIRPILLILFALASFWIPTLITRSGISDISDEATAQIFGVVITAISALFLVFEMEDSDRTNRCNIMITLNSYFCENERLMNLYQELNECSKNPEKTLDIDDDEPSKVHNGDLMAYLTFYEVINEHIKQGVLDIRQMDDLFGDRFFKIMHNDYVQQHEIYAEPSSYVNIFQLYEKWDTYRKINSEKQEKRFIVGINNEIPELYLKNKLYLRETAQLNMNKDKVKLKRSTGESRTFKQRRLFPEDWSAFYELQSIIVEEILMRLKTERKLVSIDKTENIRYKRYDLDENNKTVSTSDKPSEKDIPATDNEVDVIYVSTTKDEFYESVLLDYCYGLFDEEDKLAAVCICVLNRKTKYADSSERNLYEKLQSKLPKNVSYNDCLTFDSVMVRKDCRGYGIERYFIDEVEAVAKIVNARFILATVSPYNGPSLMAFIKTGFEFPEKAKKMYAKGYERFLVMKDLTIIRTESKKTENEKVNTPAEVK